MFLSIQLLKIVIFKELYKHVTHSKAFSRNHELETYFQFCENAKSRRAKKKNKETNYVIMRHQNDPFCNQLILKIMQAHFLS